MTQPLCADAHGFSLHAGVRCAAHQRKELERLSRCITRPAIANERLRLNHAVQAVLKLKTPYRDGTSHLAMSPVEFMQRLAAIVPRPRRHLTRFYGVLAPHAADCDRAHVTRARMSWARLLKRVSDIDVERCVCGGKLKIIAATETPAVTGRILTRLGLSAHPPPRTTARSIDLYPAA